MNALFCVAIAFSLAEGMQQALPAPFSIAFELELDAALFAEESAKNSLATSFPSCSTSAVSDLVSGERPINSQGVLP